MIQTPYLDEIQSIAGELLEEMQMLAKDNDDENITYCLDLAKGLDVLLKEHRYNLDKAKKTLDFVFEHSKAKEYID